MRRNIKDRSRDHRTQLQTIVRVGGRRESVSMCLPGRDVWAYQMAKIELQNKVLQARRRLAQPSVSSERVREFCK